MSRKEEYEAKTEELIQPILDANQCQLVDVEFVREAGTWYLRVYADKEGGITIDDCEAISRAFSDVLDEKDYIEESYCFEVSSPGLDRPLRKDKDFERAIGDEVEIRLYQPIDKQKEFIGRLISYTKDSVCILPREYYEPEDMSKCMNFERRQIALIRLSFEW